MSNKSCKVMSASGEITSEKNSNETKSDFPLASTLPPEKSIEDNEVLENGRVLRPGSTTNSTKSQNGPKLRTTVKPVKRFPFPNPAANSSSSDSGVVAANTAANPQPRTNGSSVDLLQPRSTTPILVSTSNKAADDNKLQETLPEAGTSKEVQTTTSRWSKHSKIWALKDINMFYAALEVHGKDFEAVRLWMETKRKNAGLPGKSKTREQVRHYYYRTSAYVFKVLDEPIKKSRELTVILGFVLVRRSYESETMFLKYGIPKLKQLLYGDSMGVHLRPINKSTPRRSAIKALEQILANQAKVRAAQFPPAGCTHRKVKVPLRVTLELLPLTMFAWNRVTTVGHNPRIKFDIPIECQIKEIIQHLQLKWRFMSDKLYMIANEGRLKKEISLNDANKYLSESSKTLSIFLPLSSNFRNNGNIYVTDIIKRKKCRIFCYSYTSRKKSIVQKEDDMKKTNGVGETNEDDKTVVPTATSLVEKRKLPTTSTEEKQDEPSEKKIKEENPRTSEVEVQKPSPNVEIAQAPPKNPPPSPSTCNETGEPSPSSSTTVEEPGPSASTTVKEPVPSSSTTVENGNEKTNKLPNVVFRYPKVKSERKKYERRGETEVDGIKTLAELYILFGSPDVLKLCYDWKPICKPPSMVSFPSKSNSTPGQSSESGARGPMPTALSALIDVATAMQARLPKDTPTACKKVKKKPPPPPPKIATTNRAVQCNIPIKKAPKPPKPPKATAKTSKAATKPPKDETKPPKDATKPPQATPKPTPMKVPKPPKPPKRPKLPKPPKAGVNTPKSRGSKLHLVAQKTADGFIIPALPRIYKHKNHIRDDADITSEFGSRKEVLAINRRRHLFKLSGKPDADKAPADKDCMVNGISPILDTHNTRFSMLMKKLSPPSTPESSSLSQQLTSAVTDATTSGVVNNVILHDEDSLSSVSDILSRVVDDADMNKMDDVLSRIVRGANIGEASSADLNAICSQIEKSSASTRALRIAATTASSLPVQQPTNATLTTTLQAPSSSFAVSSGKAEGFLLSPELVQYLQNHNSRESYELTVAGNGDRQQQEKQQQQQPAVKESRHQEESRPQKLQYPPDPVTRDTLNLMGEVGASTSAAIMPPSSPQFSSFMKDAVSTPTHLFLGENSKDGATVLKELSRALPGSLTEDTDSRDASLFFPMHKQPSSSQPLDESRKDGERKELPMMDDSLDASMLQYFPDDSLPRPSQQMSPSLHMLSSPQLFNHWKTPGSTPKYASIPHNTISTPHYSFTPQRTFPNEDSQDSLIFSLSQCHSKFPAASSASNSPRRPEEQGRGAAALLMGDESVDLIQHFNNLIKETDTVEQLPDDGSGPA